MPPERLPYHRDEPPPDGFRVLIIDDEAAHAEVVAEVLRRVGYDCTIATSGAAGSRLLEAEDFDVVLTDLRLGDTDGLAIVRKVKHDLPDAEVVVITGHGDVRTAVEAMKQGASNYLEKPVDMVQLRHIVEKAAQRPRLAKVNKELKRRLDERFGFEGIVGNSPRMHEVINKLKAVAPTSATVLILGETGTGKELVAKALHNNSPRKNKPFAALNCSALNENLLDDEMFGHEKGAYTDASQMRKGRFEYANGGTLFLDEVGDMPLALQAKLLRVLENGEVFRIGSNEPIRVNVRVVSATHKNLEAAVAEGKFRHDLYFRLKVVTIRLPPLRERREDIPLLAAHFIKEFNEKYGKNVKGLAEPVRKLMLQNDWVGNVRELRNAIESMVINDQDSVLGLDDTQDVDAFRRGGENNQAPCGADGLIGRPLNEVERYYAEQALQLTEGNREEAAKMLGIGERTLYRLIQDWKLQDRIKKALEESHGDVAAAAKKLGISEAALQRKLKKWGVRDGEGREPLGPDEPG
jgi:two-component system response regulator HydG